MSESDASGPSGGPETAAADYRVLARKYRPTRFDDMIGQEAMVRTLTNAIAAGRLAHAFLLTGVRGVGKTTTARILARGMNCTGPDGDPNQGENYGPTTDPCGVCDACVSIAEDRNVDVIEMDAASRTGVDDVREIIDGVRYRPTMARYKVYIIDEVHMLSKNAFNALLKTLEEPPPHVKFIFATTELRKIPVTVLSRCQRFDLRRMDAETLIDHFRGICEKESVAIDDEALALVARAADGSVRDGLSLLDQAMATAHGPVTAEAVRAMLGLADRSVTFDIFEALMGGDAPKALALAETQHGVGADPAQIVEDLLSLTHWVTRIKISKATAERATVAEAERSRGVALSDALSMAALSRAWQILLKGLDEVRRAPDAVQAFDMVIVRLAYASSLPSPADAIKAATGQTTAAASPDASPAGGASPDGGAPQARLRAVSGGGGEAVGAPLTPPADAVAAPAADTQPAADADPAPETFADLVARVAASRDMLVHAFLTNDVGLVSYQPGRLEIHLTDESNREGLQRLHGVLKDMPGAPWSVVLSTAPGAAPLSAQKKERRAEAEQAALSDPTIKAVFEHFPDATIESVRLPDETD
jgi:DNA polymerase-3 subunit gamma/tau